MKQIVYGILQILWGFPQTLLGVCGISLYREGASLPVSRCNSDRMEEKDRAIFRLVFVCTGG